MLDIFLLLIWPYYKSAIVYGYVTEAWASFRYWCSYTFVGSPLLQTLLQSCVYIYRVLPNKDGNVHCVEILKPDGTILLRDIRSICQLEVDIE